MTKQLELKRISESVPSCVHYRACPVVTEHINKQLQADQQVLDNVKQAIFDDVIDNELMCPADKHECHQCKSLKKKWLK